jgi:DNA-binding transcriptional regulator YiaG
VLVVTTWKGETGAALRLALRMTRDEFAEHLGVSVRGVAKWEAHADVELALRSHRAPFASHLIS